MNMRMLVLLIACVMLPTLAQAADPAETAALTAKRTTLLQKLGPVGATITSLILHHYKEMFILGRYFIKTIEYEREMYICVMYFFHCFLF